MKNIMFIFGTRPEAIKLIPIILEMKKSRKLNPILCVTAQHRGMLDQVLNIFNLKSDFDLDIMRQKQSLSDIISMSMKKLEEVIKKTLPDLLVMSYAAAKTQKIRIYR